MVKIMYSSLTSIVHASNTFDSCISVADPGLPRRGGNPSVLGKNLLFGKIFAEKCMKMKEIGPKEGAGL